jgi:uncharacterized membrane protein
MQGQIEMTIAMLLIITGIGGLIYSMVLLQDCKKIINKMQKRSKKYIKALDKSIKSYQK